MGIKNKIFGEGLELEEGFKDTKEALKAIPEAIAEAFRAMRSFFSEALKMYDEE